MNLWAIGVYCLLVAIYFVPVIIFIRRRRKGDRPAPTQHDQSPLDGLVATMPVDRW
jgi:heme/copper-type cytochrome/quinol oxidase subunit 2